MTTRKAVSFRLGTEGKAQVFRDLSEIGDRGEEVARRYARAAERASDEARRAREREREALANLANVTPQTPVQRIYQAGASTNYTGSSARESAQAFQELARSEAELETRTRALLSVIDPVWAAQQRFNNEVREAKILLDAGKISTEQYAAAETRATQALNAANAARARGAASVGQLRAGTQQLSFQIGDVAQQFALGTPPMTIFAQQAGQTAQAIQLMTNRTTGFIGFMSGPWGAVLLGATTILATLGAAYFDGSKAAEERKKAEEALAKALEDSEKASRAAIDSTYAKARADRVGALQALSNAEITGAQIDAQLRLALAIAEGNRVAARFGGGSFAGASRAATDLGQQRAESDAARLRELLEKNSKTIALNRSKILNLDLADTSRQVAEAADPGTRIRGQFERAQDRLVLQARQGKISTEEYRAALLKLTQARDADLKAIDASERSERRGASARERAAKAALREQEKIREDLAKFALGVNRDIVADRPRFEDSESFRSAIDEFKRNEELAAGRVRVQNESAGRGIDILAQQQASIALGERELQLLGLNDERRVAEIRKLELINDLIRDGIDVTGEQGQAILRNAEYLDQVNAMVRQQSDSWDALRQTGGQAIDTLFDVQRWNDWGDLGKRVINDLINDMIRLAVINPLKNQLFGGDAPTLGGIFGKLLGGGSNYSISFATGTQYAAGGLSLVGENGPEIAALPRGSRVIPAAETRRMLAGGGAPAVTVVTNIDATGADAAGLARVQQELAQLRAEIPARAIEAFEESRSRNMVR